MTAAAEASERVDLVVPVRPQYALSLRVLGALVAAEHGFRYRDIDDLWLALTEAFELFLAGCTGGRVRVRFDVAGGAATDGATDGASGGDPPGDPLLRVSLRIEPGGPQGVVMVDELARRILASVVDACALDDAGIVLEKRRTV